MDTTIALSQVYKDHTVPNPVDDLRIDKLPLNAYTVHNQSIRNLTVTIQVLDELDGSVIETITGKASAGKINVDANSLVRRTGSLTLKVEDDLFPQSGSLIWFNRYMKIYVGIDDNMMSDHTVNFLVGTFWIEEGSYSIDEDKSEIEVKLQDKMMKWDGNKLENPLRIDVDTPIDEAIRILMESFGETEFGDIVKGRDGEVVPYTMEYGIGDDILTVITDLRDMYMDYHCGYNVRGEFELTRVELQREEDLPETKWKFDIDDSSELKTLVSFKESYNLKNIKNRIVVYGGTSEVTGITPSSEARITDAKSPFNVYSIGEKTDILVDEKYVTNEQCDALARFTVLQQSNFQEICDIQSIPIYLLDANDIVEVKHPKTGQESKYVIDTIGFDLTTDALMSIKAHKVYYTTLEYGRDKDPIIDAIIKGISNYGWLSLGEERISQCYNLVGSGKNTISVRFQDHILGGEQASMTSYATTRNQSMLIDLADMAELDINSEDGGYISGSRRSKADYLDRVLGHEMVHAVHNDVYGHDNMIQWPVWAKEGFAEFLHGGKLRFESVYPEKGQATKKEELIALSEWLLDNNFNGSSEDYVASYLIAIAIYRIAQRKGLWTNIFISMRNQVNVGINFLLKLLPVSGTNDEVKVMVVNELRNMDEVWDMLFDRHDLDTGSVGGIHFMNLYGIPLTNETVFNNANAMVDSVGFKLQFIK